MRDYTFLQGHNSENVETMRKEDRLLTINFNADTAAAMRWKFRPQQPVVKLYPGEEIILNKTLSQIR
jgi:cytochrome c oxidase assembly protein subunit 11